MPYYTETFTNEKAPSAVYDAGVLVKSGLVALDTVELTGFRTRPHKAAVSFMEVADQSADPYAYFLESTSRKKYHDRLIERGLQSHGDPDRGHPMELKRHTLLGPRYDVSVLDRGPGTTRHFTNAQVYPILVGVPKAHVDAVHGGSFFAPAPYKEVGLDVFAQQAYAKVAPTSVVFDAGLFLGELREGLPSLSLAAITGKMDFFRRIGSGYLNAEFGWKPFISDFQNAVKALSQATEMLSQQGQRVHRKFGLPTFSQYESATGSGRLHLDAGFRRGFSPNDESLVPSSLFDQNSYRNADVTIAKTRSSTRWFEGEFSSFYPLGFDPTSYIERANVLTNTKFTPSVLWELSPWSWLIDWQLRIGDTIRANEINANDLLVMHYGYAMEHTVYQTSGWYRDLGDSQPQYYRTTGIPQKGFYGSKTEFKRRLRANPYGFRIGGASSLTGDQYSILGALGLTKLK